MPTYSQGMVATGARTLYVSGQVAVGAARADGIAAKAEAVFENLRLVLSAAAMTMTDVAKLTVYLTDETDLSGFMAVYSARSPSPPPAVTLVIVKALTAPQYLVEVEAIAVR
ncbi:RidA family protein [Phreatobacter stygius]|uniref:RidA family protein n=2 Tax=Phreatobacter stygius TaxID=1940610 RepID=A0A4D7BKI2_9HYPH|nr:RidA family protein [Phreatobacter stygius]